MSVEPLSRYCRDCEVVHMDGTCPANDQAEVESSTEAQHPTPGPWLSFGESGDLYVEAVKGVGFTGVCKITSESPEADARLIVAAPDLLKALQDIMRVIATDALVPESVSYMRQARAAIAKAVRS